MILDTIVASVKKNVLRQQKELPLTDIQHRLETNKILARSFAAALQKVDRLTLIAELKRASPTKGTINLDVDIISQAKQYEAAGAAAISVVTNEEFFKGSPYFLCTVRPATNIPLLRKDFIIDPYQIYESKYLGADAILLIARILTETQLTEFIKITANIGLECLVEVASRDDIDKALAAGANTIGINTRDLDTFTIHPERVAELKSYLPTSCVVVAESGIETGEDTRKLKAQGVQAILVGTTLMQAKDVAAKIQELTNC